jgi:SPP1 gp7 family putative phage head morphogenesis protein
MKTKLGAGQVSQEQRHLADLMDRDTRKWQQIGIVEARRRCWDASQAAMGEYKAGRQGIARAMRRELWKGVPTLAKGMLTSWLAGYVRSHQNADITLSVGEGSGYQGAMQFFEKRIDLTQRQMEKLESKFNTKALWMYRGLSRRAEHKLENAMTDIAAQGLPVRQGVMKLHDAFTKAGIMPNNSYAIENLYRTNLAIAYSGARRYAAKQPAIDEILWGHKYITVGDDRVRPSHELLDGVTLPKDHPFWDTCIPPCGWSCRCSWVDLFHEEDEVEPPEGPVDVDGTDVEAGPDDGFDFDPGNFYGSIMDPDSMEEDEEEDSPSADEDGGEEAPSLFPTKKQLVSYLETLDEDEIEELAELLGVDEEDLEDGKLEFSLSI